MSKLKVLKERLKEWNEVVFEDIQVRKDDILRVRQLGFRG